ncbi:unnamed protein product [Rotaria sp. Silwood1]|nr:unnamed protein product [Rotaria sp. Silwood1]
MLSLSIFGVPILFTFEGLFHGFSLGEPLITIILCIALIILITILCSTNNIKKLLMFVSINTVLILILFFIKIVLLYNFLENGRQAFHRLMEKYPHGEEPDSSQFLSYYIPIKHEQCCGIDNNQNLSVEESTYFRVNFYDNCIMIFPPSSDSEHPYRGQPCMNYVHAWRRQIITFILLVMADVLPISLSVLLSLSVFGAPGLYIIEGFLHGFTLGGALTAIILCSVQINLIIILCVTRNIKILTVFLIVVTVIVISFTLGLFWIYLLLRPRKQNRMIQPLTGILNNQRRIYPSSTSLNYPSNTLIIPSTHQNILSDENKINNN